MKSWKEFGNLQPELAQFGKEHFSSKVAFLGTVRKSGFRRVHPVCPIVSDYNFFVFMEPTSPKGKDLIANDKFSLHSLVTDSNGSTGEFWLSGHAFLVSNEILRTEAIQSSSYKPKDRYILFQLYVTEAGSNYYSSTGTPNYNRWKEK